MKGLQITAPGQFRLVDVPGPGAVPGRDPGQGPRLQQLHALGPSIWEGYDIFSRPGHAPAYPYGIGSPGPRVGRARWWPAATGSPGSGSATASPPAAAGTPRPAAASDGRAGPPAPAGRPALRRLHASTWSPAPTPCRSTRAMGSSYNEIAMQEMLGCVGPGDRHRRGLHQAAGGRVGDGRGGPDDARRRRASWARRSSSAVDIDPQRLEIASALGAGPACSARRRRVEPPPGGRVQHRHRLLRLAAGDRERAGAHRAAGW